MRTLETGGLRFSPTDLVNHLSCRHLTGLNHAAAIGELTRPRGREKATALVAHHGDVHERRYLEQLIAEGHDVVEIELRDEDPAAATVEAMHAGADVIYQATFLHDGWVGHADFVIRCDRPSELGEFSYEVFDTKLSRTAKPTALVQLAEYSAHITRVQGVEPESVHLVLGDQSIESFRLASISPYHRSIRADFLQSVGPAMLDVYPDPVAHCSRCDWSGHCKARRVADDHLTLVADLGRTQANTLEAAGITTMSGLAAHRDGDPRPDMDSFERLRSQAQIQHRAGPDGAEYELLAPASEYDEAPVGFAKLPAPTDRDLFFDIESDPFLQVGGVEYLFGVTDIDDAFEPVWALQPTEEKRAFEATIDRFTAALAADPAMRIYHFGIYEPVAMKRLAARYGTRQLELDRLLRGEVFVDLHRVTKQALRASVDSYSIKKLERFYRPNRETDVSSGIESAVEYERWLDSNDRQHLDRIAEYNRDDCESTRGLRDWLEQLRVEAESLYGHIERPQRKDPDLPGESVERARELDDLRDALLELVPELRSDRTDEQQGIWLLAQLVQWHAREERTDWWDHFNRLDMTPDELIADGTALGGLVFSHEADPVARSKVFVYDYAPHQDTKLKKGSSVFDAGREGARTGEILQVDYGASQVHLKVGPSISDRPHPTAIVPDATVPARAQKASLQALAEKVRDRGWARLAAEQPAIVALLAREKAGAAPYSNEMRDGDAAAHARQRARGLEGGYLAIQGPPGAGKTWTAANIVCDLVEQGQQIGITAHSHAVIENLLTAVKRESDHRGLDARLARKPDSDPTDLDGIEKFTDNKKLDEAIAEGEVDVIGATTFYFARAEVRGQLGTLVIDEAGQMSLANAVAATPAASNLILVGDPQQLDQPARAVHPEGAEGSALAHLLGEQRTIATSQGVFLPQTRRMHPDITRFISEQFYEGRLSSHSLTAGQALHPVGTGLRFEPVAHTGNKSSSDEEVARVDELVTELLGQRWTDQEGSNRSITGEDILVVAPFNAQVTRLRHRLDSRARVGTVDLFQGQEAPIVIYSMTSSDSTLAPRGMDFLYSTNRLNVAVSRAQGLAIIVASPQLRQPLCTRAEHVPLASALCRFVELAEDWQVNTA